MRCFKLLALGPARVKHARCGYFGRDTHGAIFTGIVLHNPWRLRIHVRKPVPPRGAHVIQLRHLRVEANAGGMAANTEPRLAGQDRTCCTRNSGVQCLTAGHCDTMDRGNSTGSCDSMTSAMSTSSPACFTSNVVRMTADGPTRISFATFTQCVVKTRTGSRANSATAAASAYTIFIVKIASALADYPEQAGMWTEPAPSFWRAAALDFQCFFVTIATVIGASGKRGGLCCVCAPLLRAV